MGLTGIGYKTEYNTKWDVMFSPLSNLHIEAQKIKGGKVSKEQNINENVPSSTLSYFIPILTAALSFFTLSISVANFDFWN